jgi:hypothetical protein
MTLSSFKKTLAAAVLGLSAAHANAAFDITLNFDASVSGLYGSYFVAAEKYWESVITGYQKDVALTGLSISVSTAAIDGVGGILGSAGPTSASNAGGYSFASQGMMEFDSADVVSMISNNTFTSVIEHEMAHVIGFGTLWTHNQVYLDGSGQYTGSNALAAYRTEFNQPTAIYVPVELGGSSGTSNSHWNEVDGGSGATGILAGSHDMEYELMTGWLNEPTFTSRTTIASFVDIGYTVSAVPEPETFMMYALGLAVLLRLGARRKKQVG